MAFNQLTAAEAERLALLAEELAEAIALIGKVMRHGYESFNPDDEAAGNNAQQLAGELGDVHYAVQLLVVAGDLDEDEIIAARRAAAIKKPEYLHHQTKAILSVLSESAT